MNQFLNRFYETNCSKEPILENNSDFTGACCEVVVVSYSLAYPPSMEREHCSFWVEREGLLKDSDISFEI